MTSFEAPDTGNMFHKPSLHRSNVRKTAYPSLCAASLPPVFFCLVPTGLVRSLVSRWWIVCRMQNTQILRTSLCSHIVTVSLVVCPILLMGYEYGLTHRRPPND